jgi:predicted GNAT family acetyltransferase
MTRIGHNADSKRYELFVGETLASLADYRVEDDRVVIFHTETRDDFRGQGLAAKLVRWMLDDIRARGQTVVPDCWFVTDFIEAHPEYRDLVAA